MTAEILPAQATLAAPGEEEGDTGLQLILDLQAAGALTPVSLDLSDPHLPIERYAALGRFLGRVKRATSWWIGDWINFGEGAYGQKYAAVAEATGLSPETLMNYAWVCRQIPKSRRVVGLAFSIHAEVASLPPDEQRHWLQEAVDRDLSRSDLRLAIRKAKGTLGEDEPGSAGAGSDLSRREVLTEIGHAILRDATVKGDRVWIPIEAYRRLASALGEGE